MSIESRCIGSISPEDSLLLIYKVLVGVSRVILRGEIMTLGSWAKRRWTRWFRLSMDTIGFFYEVMVKSSWMYSVVNSWWWTLGPQGIDLSDSGSVGIIGSLQVSQHGPSLDLIPFSFALIAHYGIKHFSQDFQKNSRLGSMGKNRLSVGLLIWSFKQYKPNF